LKISAKRSMHSLEKEPTL